MLKRKMEGLKHKLSASSTFTVPQKRKFSNKSENENKDVKNGFEMTDKKPRKGKRFKSKELKNKKQMESQFKDPQFNEKVFDSNGCENTNEKESILIPCLSFQANSMRHENATEVIEQTTAFNMELNEEENETEVIDETSAVNIKFNEEENASEVIDETPAVNMELNEEENANEVIDKSPAVNIELNEPRRIVQDNSKVHETEPEVEDQKFAINIELNDVDHNPISFKKSSTVHENKTEVRDKIISANIELNNTNNKPEQTFREHSKEQKNTTEKMDTTVASKIELNIDHDNPSQHFEDSSSELENGTVGIDYTNDLSMDLNNLSNPFQDLFKIFNVQETVLNVHEAVKPAFKDMKIPKVVLEDTHNIQDKVSKDELVREHTLENSCFEDNAKCLKNSQEKRNIDNISENIQQELDKPKGIEQKQIIVGNTLNCLEGNESNSANFEIQADDGDLSNEHAHNVEYKENINKTNENCNNILFDNSSITANLLDQESYQNLNIISNKQNQNIDFNKNIPNPVLKHSLKDIRNEHTQNHALRYTKSPEVFVSNTKPIKKFLTIPCMNALDFAKECEKNEASSSLNCKEISETEISQQKDLVEKNIIDTDLHLLRDLKSLEVVNGNEKSKNILTIPCMSALDYERECELNKASSSNKCKELTEIEVYSVPQVQKSGDLHALNLSENDGCLVKNVEDLKNKGITQIKEQVFEQETNGKAESSVNFHQILQSNELILNDANTRSSAINHSLAKMDPNGSIKLETITFREKDENSNSDIIPTGVFKYLNEVFEFDKETTSILVKDSPSKALPCEDLLIKKEENVGENKIKSRTARIEEESMFLVTASDCIKINRNRPISQNLADFEGSNENCTPKDKEKEESIHKGQSCSSEEPEYELNKTKIQLIENIPKIKRSMFEEHEFSDIETCMEMDDDFALTASQLRMIDADEKLQSQPEHMTTSSQQTDICGYTYFGNDAVAFEIINQLQYIRESVDYIRKRLETSVSKDEVCKE